MTEASSEQDKKTTPKEFSSPKDARDMKASGKYPNFRTQRTRSGHIFTMDDSKEGEHITLQHRGGSMIQFMPDGAVQFVSHNGQYNFVFGENRVKITGAYDVVVEGGGSLKVDGDYNMTVKGHVNWAVGKDFNMTAQNMNQVVRGNIDTLAKNRTEKIEGNISQTAKTQVISAEYGMTIKSTGDTLALSAKKDVGIASISGEARVYSKGDLSILSDGGNIKMKSSQMNIESTGDLHIKSGGEVRFKAEQKMDIKAGPLRIPGNTIGTATGSATLDDPDGASPSPAHQVKQSPPPTIETNYDNVG